MAYNKAFNTVEALPANIDKTHTHTHTHTHTLTHSHTHTHTEGERRHEIIYRSHSVLLALRIDIIQISFSVIFDQERGPPRHHLESNRRNTKHQKTKERSIE